MDSEIEIRHLRAFTAVASHMHFGRAAQQLHLAQPALSQQIRKFEDLLGYRLFTRTSRSVTLTAAGEVFLQRARRTLQALSTDIEEMRSISRGEVGFLNIGFIGSGMLTTLPSALERYRKSFPRVEMHLFESFTSGVLDGLASGSLDAGLVRDSEAVPGIRCEPLFTEPFVAVLPTDHPLAKRRSLRGSALHGEPFVFYARSAGALAYDKPLSLCAEDGVKPRVVQEASHWLTILRLVEAGLGVSIAPACVRSIASANVACIPLSGTTVRSSVELALRVGEQRPIVQQFAELARRTGTRAGKLQRRPSTYAS